MVLAMKRDVDLQRDVIDELTYDPEIDAADIGVTMDDGAGQSHLIRQES